MQPGQGKFLCYIFSMTKLGRPATGQTPVRTVRIGAAWDEAKATADEHGDRMADIIEAALRRYVQRKRAKDAAAS